MVAVAVAKDNAELVVALRTRLNLQKEIEYSRAAPQSAAHERAIAKLHLKLDALNSRIRALHAAEARCCCCRVYALRVWGVGSVRRGYVVVLLLLLYVASYVASVRADTRLGAAAMLLCCWWWWWW